MPTTIFMEGENQLLLELAFLMRPRIIISAALKLAIEHALAEGTDCLDAVVLLTLHELGLASHGNELACALLEGHDRGLVDDDLVVVYDDSIGRSEVNGYLFGE